MSLLVIVQSALGVTGTPQNLPNRPVNKNLPFTLTAKSTNAAAVTVGNAATVTGITGYVLEAGKSVLLGITNTNEIWVVGTGADIVSGIGTD